MLDPAALATFRPFIATPSYNASLATAYVHGLLDLVNAAWTRGFAMQTRFLDSDSLVTRARNRLVAEFMADARWTHLLFIDADIGFTAEAVLRLLLSGHDVVAGVYPHKLDNWPAQGLHEALPAGTQRADFEARYPSFPVNLLGDARQVDRDGFLEVAEAPSGFMLIARGVFERMAAALPALRYTPDGVGNAASAAARQWPHYRFFDTLAEPDNGRYLTEDYAFCRRWRAVGGQVFVDAQSRLTHQGLRTYSGDFARALR